uniref:Serine/threonine protein kinase n=1 Tax=Solibacter usitatus (strain Ellin6076) TaxID=234267 RepID=Q01T31_SOLUE
MALSAGSKLGPYEIVAPLGAGGMGEVYRAHDSRLGRDVALKILPAEVARDPVSRARFEQEARAVAALNHPNIVAVYDVGEGYFVSELVDGESLRGAKFSLRKTLDIAAQIASGIAAAHAAGIVHRDLKPGNILVTHDGRAKILDFGLARIRPTKAASALDQTVTAHTEAGTVVGTVSYMSPEQVRGLEVDHRSDIFSFGIMLHGMLGGSRTFHGETTVDTMQAILRQDPPELPDTVPPMLRDIVTRCLEKEPGQRFQSAKDLEFALLSSAGRSGSASAVAPALRGVAWRWPAALVLCAGLAFGAGVWLRRAPQPPRWSAALLPVASAASCPRLSPDGQTLAFTPFVSGVTQVAVMTPASGDIAVLTHATAEGSVEQVSWSADGTRLYFDRLTDVPRGVYSVPKLGGKEQLLLEDASNPEALADGSLLVTRLNAARKHQIFRFWTDSGRVEALPVLLKMVGDRSIVRAFPDGKSAVAYGTPANAAGSSPALYRIEIGSGAVRLLDPGPPEGAEVGGLAVTRDGKRVLFATSRRSAYTVKSIPADGNGPSPEVLLLTGAAYSLDAGPDGSIYLDQWHRASTLLRFSASGGHAEQFAEFPARVLNREDIAILRDGRTVVSQRIGASTRLLALEPGKDPAPLIYTSESTGSPVAEDGPGQVVFLVGTPPKIGVASVSNGRILRRIPFNHGEITALAATPDGRTIFCAAGGMVWVIPEAGEPKELRAGDAIAVDPAGKFVLVEVGETPVIRLIRVPLDGSREQEIPRGETGRPASALTPNAIGKDGRILTPMGGSTWNWPAGILDASTGRYTRIALDRDVDYHALAWAPDGRIVALASGAETTLWKFTPEVK